MPNNIWQRLQNDSRTISERLRVVSWFLPVFSSVSCFVSVILLWRDIFSDILIVLSCIIISDTKDNKEGRGGDRVYHQELGFTMLGYWFTMMCWWKTLYHCSIIFYQVRVITLGKNKVCINNKIKYDLTPSRR